MRILLTTIFLVFIASTGFGQGLPQVVDSFKRQLAVAATIEDKFTLISALAKTYMNIDHAEADKYGRQLIELAETSRKRDLMVRALLSNGERFSFLAGRRENIEKAISYYERGLSLARQNKLDSLVIKAYLQLSEVHRYIPDYEKALNYCNQANSYSVILKNDSITARVHVEYGSVFMGKNEKLLALRSLLAAIRIAEEKKNIALLRVGYNKLSVFYSTIEDYNRAIDYQVRSTALIGQLSGPQSPYVRVQEYNNTGDLYAYKKDYDMANYYYEMAIRLADSVKFEPIKAMSYRSIMNNFLASGQPQKALDYFNEHPQLAQFLERVNFGHFIDQSYGYIYMQLGKYDSAKYFYNKIAPIFEKDVNTANQFGYNYQLGLLYSKTGETDKSLAYLSKAKDIADKVGNLDQMKVVAEMLDSVYQRKGDYKQALYFASLTSQYKDSIDKLGREKDLMQAESDDELQRSERIAKEQLEKNRRRNNIQYMMITFGIIGLFVALVVLGMFKVSSNTIRMIGFFAFLMFFEFIFLIFKKNIYSITRGEPWKDLLFMIGLAALLLPLHHWLEHRVIHYLTSHNRLTAAGKHIRSKLFRRKEG